MYSDRAGSMIGWKMGEGRVGEGVSYSNNSVRSLVQWRTLIVRKVWKYDTIRSRICGVNSVSKVYMYVNRFYINPIILLYAILNQYISNLNWVY